MTPASPVLVTMVGPVADDVRRIELPRAMTVAEAIETNDIKFRLPTIAVLSGIDKEPVPVLRGQWHVRVVRPGETLALVAVPGRGGSGSGKQVAAIVATIALAIAAPHVGTAVAAGLQLTGQAALFASAVASTAFMARGPILMDALERQP